MRSNGGKIISNNFSQKTYSRSRPNLYSSPTQYSNFNENNYFRQNLISQLETNQYFWDASNRLIDDRLAYNQNKITNQMSTDLFLPLNNPVINSRFVSFV